MRPDGRGGEKARYLIADDVGLGKTLSMAAAALVLSLLEDRPVLAPATLIWQWQEELEDKLDVPSAVWSTTKKCWLDSERRTLTQRGDPALVAKCPWRIGIVSTGLIVDGDDHSERGAGKEELRRRHSRRGAQARASRSMNGREVPKPNNLLEFLRKASIQNGDIRLVCATDAACEGLNLQRLGAQVNIDLPWDPSRLEQRKGRVQRIGQVRDNVHILNLRSAGAVEDDWIKAVLQDRSAVGNFSLRVETTRPPMELRYLRDVADDRASIENTPSGCYPHAVWTWMREGW